MPTSIFLPQPGLRFTFSNQDDYVFEITTITYGIIRYAAVIGGKSFTLSLESFEQYFKNDEIKCVLAPEKLIINPDKCSEIQRKERYVKSALYKLYAPTALIPLKNLITEVATDIEDQKPPSPRTVARWINKYRSSSHNNLSLSGEYKGNKTLRFPPEIYQIISQGIKEIYLTPEYRTSKDVQAYILGKLIEQGISTRYLPSKRTIQRYIEKLDPYLVTKIKKGSRVARKTFQASGQSCPSPFALYMVEIDTHYLDIIVIDPVTHQVLGRPYLACAIDVHSRVIVGTYISMFPPSALTTLAVIKDMITRPNRGLPGGIASIIIPDNGIEFKNNALARVCEQLKITLTPSQIGTPNNKPHIERFFSTLTKGIIQKLSGTTFSNPNERGLYNASEKASYSLEQVKEYITEWINEVYQQSIHSQTGRAPISMWNDAIEYIKPSFLTEVDAKIICRRPVERTINNGRVQIDGLTYYSHALTVLQAKKIKKVTVLIDELNLNEVYILAPNDKQVLIQADSTNPEYTMHLSRFVHLEVQNRKKLMADSDRQKLGGFADLYNLYGLMQDIQADLVRKKPKLKQVKIDVPKQLQRLQESFGLNPTNHIEKLQPNKEKNQKEDIPPSIRFGSMEVKKDEKR
ncbi:Mu transposase C-terminal domain-containing protein [Acinetobacter modestus]|uniref:Mu transposase C-terminal domain-containing protein n=1 Tax=Acinetobacter modestus TaxID=1776740 RepID=UPI001F4B79A0|nr:Mu transposase C-terminal domain-containing protein [Acinetobacter modestus]MCH7333986.1 DDE-type integrase/transposase/recombinase [Acinetobacter modestus]